MPIMKEVQSGKNIAKVWTDDIEPDAYQQILNVTALPFIYHHVAIMADVHKGWGCPVGSVIATRGTVMPACVGVDIGCGMCAVKTPFKVVQLEGKLTEIRSMIESLIPLGFDSNRHIDNAVYDWPGWKRWSDLASRVQTLKDKALSQLGSLGGGNHFIEICRDEEESVWILLHSGSRHIGKAIADVHVGIAKRLMDKEGIRLADGDLAYLKEGTREFKDYIHDASWAQEYARQNRKIMMERVCAVMGRLLANGKSLDKLVEVNCHHNYVSEEEHFGKRVFVTRKGAVRAGMGERGIIPGSMGSHSFIVKGLGNPESFCSCSHGAGRRMSRHEALRRFDREDLARETQGVECRKDRHVVDEIPSAYKNIEDVIKLQNDLVSIEARLKQLICIKG